MIGRIVFLYSRLLRKEQWRNSVTIRWEAVPYPGPLAIQCGRLFYALLPDCPESCRVDVGSGTCIV